MDKIEKAKPISSEPFKENVASYCSRVINVLEEMIGEVRLLSSTSREDSQIYWMKKIDGKLKEINDLLDFIRNLKQE